MPDTRHPSSLCSLKNRRHSLRQALKSRETRQAFDPASNSTIKELEPLCSLKQCGNNVIRLALPLGTLTDRCPEPLNHKSDEIARKLFLRQFYARHMPIETRVC